MKKLLLVISLAALTGCSTVNTTIDTVKEYWPKSHDPVMFDKLVRLNIEVNNVD